MNRTDRTDRSENPYCSSFPTREKLIRKYRSIGPIGPNPSDCVSSNTLNLPSILGARRARKLERERAALIRGFGRSRNVIKTKENASGDDETREKPGVSSSTPGGVWGVKSLQPYPLKPPQQSNFYEDELLP